MGGSWVVGRGSWVVGRGSWVVGRGSWVVGRGSCLFEAKKKETLNKGKLSPIYFEHFPSGLANNFGKL